MTRRKQLTRDFGTCRICNYPGLWWPRKETRQTTQPLDRNRPLYVDIDARPARLLGYDREGVAVHGQLAADLATHEQRIADAGGEAGELGIRRIVKAWPVHQCPESAGTRASGPGPDLHNGRAPELALGGQDKAAGEHL